MEEVTLKNIKYTKVPNKKAGVKLSNMLTQSNIGLSLSVSEYINSDSFYSLINALDIDWNGILVEENLYINDTSDLINWIISMHEKQGGTQSDWNQVDEEALDYIKNKPSIYTKPEADEVFQPKGDYQPVGDYAPASDTARIANLEAAVGTGGSVDSRITTAVNGAKIEIKGTATSACDTLGKAESLISEEATARSNADAALSSTVGARLDAQDDEIALLNGNEVVVVEDHTAVVSPDTQKIYREYGTDSYTDWMCTDATTTPPTWQAIATYSYPGIDNEPTDGSDKLIKSGGITKIYGKYITDNDLSIIGDSKNNEIIKLDSEGNIKSQRFRDTIKHRITVNSNNCSVWDRKLPKHLSINSNLTGHYGITNDYPLRDKLAKSCVELNAYCSRASISIPNTVGMDFTKFDNAFYQLQKNGIEIIGLISFDWNLTELLDVFTSNLTSVVNRYNGVTDIYPTDANGQAVKIKISMWELFNEPSAANMNALALMSRTAYTIIKNSNSNNIVISPSTYSLGASLLSDIFSYQYDDNTYFLDYFDIVNIHYYGTDKYINSINSIRSILEDLAEIRNDKSILEKTIWVTETGYSLYNYTEKQLANLLIHDIMSLLSYGVDNVFMFQQRCSCTNLGITNMPPKEWYWGVLRDCTKNSYLCLTTIDGSNLSPGDGYKRIITSDTVLTIPISNNEVSKLTSNGLKVSGNKYVLTKIEIIRDEEVVSTPYIGTFIANGLTSLDINNNIFSSIENGDILKFTFSSVIINNEFDYLYKNKSYSALSYLYSKASEGSVPNHIASASIDIYTFVTKDNKPITIISNPTNIDINIKTDITNVNVICRDINGKRKNINLKDFILYGDDTIYIENVNEFNIEY